MNEKQTCYTQQQMTTTKLQAPDLGQTHAECGGVKLI